MPSDLQVSNIKANDGTAGISIADSTGNITLNNPITTGTFNGTIGSSGSGSPPCWCVTGAASTASSAWPPYPQNLDAVSGNFFVSTGITLNSSSDYITVTYAGKYWIFLSTRHDVGGAAASATELITFIYIKEGSYVSSSDYTKSISTGGAGGTRSDNNGALKVNGGLIVELSAGSHLWPGAYTHPTGGTSSVTHFAGVMIR